VIAIGIDIGTTGAIAAIDSKGSALVRDLPTCAASGAGRAKHRIDGKAMFLALREIVRAGEAAIAVIEDVRPLPGDGKVSSGSLMHSRGVIECALSIAGIPVHVVQPQTWQRFYDIKKADKARSLALAIDLHPGVAHMLARVKDHNRAEAVLMAHFARAEYV
jgi:hypothetical protein